MHGCFEQTFYFRPFFRADGQLALHTAKDLCRYTPADLRSQIMPALEERLDQNQVVVTETRRSQGRMRSGLPFQVIPRRLEFSQRHFPDNQRSSHEVTQALILPIQQRHDDANTVKSGHLIHDTQKIASNAFAGTKRPSAVFDYPDADGSFARRLSAPQNLKEKEIPVEQQEYGRQNTRYHPGADERNNSTQRTAGT